MKKYLLLFLVISFNSFSQVIISPYIVLVDENNRFGNFIVQNESNETYEVSISFMFGFPQSDSLGTLTMHYIDNPDSSYPSAVEWIKAFPKKFVLEPRQRQLIRMTVNANRTLTPGTYWARIVTSSAPLTVKRDSLSEGISASIKFVLNQITTLLYRVGTAETNVLLKDTYLKEDSNSVSFYSNLEREGNSPFFGDYVISIYSENGELIDEKTESISLYYNLLKKIEFENLNPGNYSAEIKITHNERRDIPESKIEIKEPILRKMQFIIN